MLEYNKLFNGGIRIYVKIIQYGEQYAKHSDSTNPEWNVDYAIDIIYYIILSSEAITAGWCCGCDANFLFIFM